MDIWVKCRAKKDAGFLWVSWHQALAVNACMECDNQPKHCGGLSLLCPSDTPDICAQILAIPKGKKGIGDGFHNHVLVKNIASHEIHP